MPILWHHFVFHCMSSTHTRLFQCIECAIFSLSLSPLPSVISSAKDLFSFPGKFQLIFQASAWDDCSSKISLTL